MPLSANRRSHLLQAAARLFVDQGYAATTTRDIAAATGMRSGSPFYHFRSKHDLLAAVIADGIENGMRRLLHEIDGIDDPAQRLRTMIRVHLGNLLGSDYHAPLLLYEGRALAAATRSELAALADRYQQPWQSTLDELAAAGKLRIAAKPARLLLFGMLNWSSQWYKPAGPMSLDEISDAAASLVLA